MLTPDALAAAFAAHHVRLVRFCASRVGPDAAEDVAGTVWLRAVEAAPSYEDRGHPIAAWLYTIARHTCANEAARARCRPMRPLTGHEWAADQYAAIDGQEAAQRLLAGLPVAHRRVLVLTAAGYTAPQTGRALGISPGAVKALLWRARQGAQRGNI